MIYACTCTYIETLVDMDKLSHPQGIHGFGEFLAKQPATVEEPLNVDMLWDSAFCPL